MGSIYKRGNVQWIAYYRNGKLYRESTGSEKEGDAETLLRLREGDIAKGVPVTPAVGRLVFSEAADDVLTDFQINAKKSEDVIEQRLRLHLLPYFGHRRMATITTGEIRAFIAKRQADTVLVRQVRRYRLPDGTLHEEPEIRKPVSNGEINRELGIIKRTFNLAIQNGKLLHKPYVPMLKESAPRSGFFEPDQAASVIRHLPEALRPVVGFAYVTGWRVTSEVLPLEWRNVDFEAGEVRLDAGTTKNGEARTFPMTADLRALLEARKAEREALKRRGIIVSRVFFRLVGERKGQPTAKPITSFTKAWRSACLAAGCPGRIPHDLRRTAVRNLVRAGIPERVAMQLTGHKTRSVFERYNVVSVGDFADAAKKLDASAVAGVIHNPCTVAPAEADSADQAAANC